MYWYRLSYHVIPVAIQCYTDEYWWYHSADTCPHFGYLNLRSPPFPGLHQLLHDRGDPNPSIAAICAWQMVVDLWWFMLLYSICIFISWLCTSMHIYVCLYRYLSSVNGKDRGPCDSLNMLPGNESQVTRRSPTLRMHWSDKENRFMIYHRIG